jgi:hypothetical protein
MKKVLTVLFILTALLSCAQDNFLYKSKVKLPEGFSVSVKQYKVTIIDTDRNQKIHYEYFVYVGNDQTRQVDNESVLVIDNICKIILVHPVADVAKDLKYPAKDRWYLEIMFLGQYFSAPLLDDPATIGILPPILAEVFYSLNYKDDDLLVIAYNIYSGSISIFYHPRFSKDKSYYDTKADMLKRAFE